jgi:RNA polymerase sigma-70 factor (ECF subfamily)
VTEFEDHRRHLFGVAYRMLGSAADAEDAVQDAWLRLQRADRSGIEDLRAWLTTVTGRICLDRLRSAQARRETYTGPWLPEPIVTRLVDPAAGPAELAELGDSVRIALLAVLERLTPEQRIAFVLHDVFGVPFGEVAAALGTSAAAARQHASRARKAVHSAEPRRTASAAEQREVLTAFFAAARSGDLGGLLQLLAPDAVLTADGGGFARAALRPITGADRIARFLLGLGDKAGGEISAEPVLVNGDAGLVLRIRDAAGAVALVAVVTATLDETRRIDTIAYLVNPEKLTRLPG